MKAVYILVTLLAMTYTLTLSAQDGFNARVTMAIQNADTVFPSYNKALKYDRDLANPNLFAMVGGGGMGGTGYIASEAYAANPELAEKFQAVLKAGALWQPSAMVGGGGMGGTGKQADFILLNGELRAVESPINEQSIIFTPAEEVIVDIETDTGEIVSPLGLAAELVDEEVLDQVRVAVPVNSIGSIMFKDGDIAEWAAAESVFKSQILKSVKTMQ